MKRVKKYFVLATAALLCTVAVCLLPLTAFAEDASLPEAPAADMTEDGGSPAQPDERPQWQVVLEEEIVPAAILVVTAICTVILTLWPIVSRTMEKVRKESEKFSSAADGVLEVSAGSNATREEIKQLGESLKGAIGEAAQMQGELNALKTVIALLAAGNEELVANGTARRIMEVLENDGEK